MSNKKDSGNSLILSVDDWTFNYIIFNSSYEIIKMFHEEFSFEKGISLFSLIKKYNIKNTFLYERPGFTHMNPVSKIFLRDYFVNATNFIHVPDTVHENCYGFVICHTKNIEFYLFEVPKKLSNCWISHNTYIQQYAKEMLCEDNYYTTKNFFRSKMYNAFVYIFIGNEHFRLSKKSPSKYRVQKIDKKIDLRNKKSILDTFSGDPETLNNYFIKVCRSNAYRKMESENPVKIAI